MITVIIPTLNEESTIASVIRKAKSCKQVTEVIVVDDNSTDNTAARALEVGAQLITSGVLGKGISMREGLRRASNELIAFLDADIPSYPHNVIEIITEPLLKHQADFVKTYFDRQAGRVTELVAKPLLSILFPQIAGFQQPLSGIVAGKKSWFEKVELENDYGVDIGLLIDMYNLGARIVEVSIGTVVNKMKAWQSLGKMSREVSSAILKRAKSLLPGHHSGVHEQTAIPMNEEQLTSPPRKMVVFDMDNTILHGSFIRVAAKDFGFEKSLLEIVAANHNAIVRTKKIAHLLKGRSMTEIIAVLEKIQVVHDFGEVVAELKKRGYITGIISDSYSQLVNHLQLKYGLDFAVANDLEFENGLCTGEVKIPVYFLRDKLSVSDADYCKSNLLLKKARELDIDVKNIIAIGDGENDLASIKLAGTGISFCSNYEYLDMVADMVIKERSFKSVLDVAA